LDELTQPPPGSIDLIRALAPNTYSLTPPSIAFERQAAARQGESADPVPRNLAAVEDAPLLSGVEEKAEDE